MMQASSLLSRIQFAFVVTFTIIFVARAVELACAASSAFAFSSAASWLSVRIGRPAPMHQSVAQLSLPYSILHPNSPADVQRTRPARVGSRSERPLRPSGADVPTSGRGDGRAGCGLRYGGAAPEGEARLRARRA